MLVSSLRFFVMPSTSLSLMRVWVVPAEDPNAVPRILGELKIDIIAANCQNC